MAGATFCHNAPGGGIWPHGAGRAEVGSCPERSEARRCCSTVEAVPRPPAALRAATTRRSPGGRPHPPPRHFDSDTTCLMCRHHRRGVESCGLPRSGVVFRSWVPYGGCVVLESLEVGVTNDYFLVHASGSVIEALIRTAGRLAPSCCAACRRPHRSPPAPTRRGLQEADQARALQAAWEAGWNAAGARVGRKAGTCVPRSMWSSGT